MTLVLSCYNNNDTIWHNKGIDDNDIEIANELGLLTPRYHKSLEEYILIDNYLNEIEDIENEFNIFMDDIKLLYGYVDNREFIEDNKIYKYIDVRIVRKNNNFSIGSIDGVSNVYIPKSISKKCSIGELIKMDLVHMPKNKNKWKAIHYHEKIKPDIINNFISIDNDNCNCNIINLSLPIQNLGKMIGKNGICIQKVINDIAYNNDELKKLLKYKNKNVDMNQDLLPRYDINNVNNKTIVTIWDKPNKRKNIKINPIIDILYKLYA